MLTFGEFGVLDLHLQLGEENVLSRVLAQVTEEDLERGGREEVGENCSVPEAAAPPTPEPRGVVGGWGSTEASQGPPAHPANGF